jgi:hypothetical protein
VRESTAIADDTAIGTMTLTKNRRSIAVLLLSVLAGAAAPPPAAGPAADLGMLTERIEHRFEVLESLRRDPGFVDSLDRSLRRGDRDGAMAWDVLLVRTRDGPMALKVYKAQHTEADLAMWLALNDYLGELGIAPKIHGYLPHEATAQVLGMRSGGDAATAISFSVLVQLAENAWNFPRDMNVPAQIATCDGGAMVERILYFQDTLKRAARQGERHPVSRLGHRRDLSLRSRPLQLDFAGERVLALPRAVHDPRGGVRQPEEALRRPPDPCPQRLLARHRVPGRLVSGRGRGGARESAGSALSARLPLLQLLSRGEFAAETRNLLKSTRESTQGFNEAAANSPRKPRRIRRGNAQFTQIYSRIYSRLQ